VVALGGKTGGVIVLGDRELRDDAATVIELGALERGRDGAARHPYTGGGDPAGR
jgi:hypothetical protein